MKKNYTYIFVLLAIINGYLLYAYGISSFLTTCIFYLLLIYGVQFFSSLLKNEMIKKNLHQNTKTLLSIFLFIEFFMTFIPPFTFMNHYSETEKKIYLSEYKRKRQSELLQKLGFNRARFTFIETYIPNSSRELKREEYTYTHHYNSIGLRGPLPNIVKDSNEYRIILLGDSFVEGDGTPDDSTISKLLETNLNKNHLKTKYTVINGGISGSNVLYEQDLYYKKLEKFNPDMIINTVFLNDILDIDIMKNQGKLPLSEYFISVSHIFRFFYFIIFRIEGYKSLNTKKRNLSKGEVKNIQLIFNEMYTFKRKLNAKKIRVINLYIPSKEQLLNNNQIFKNFGNFDIDMYDYSKNKDIPEDKLVTILYWKYDVHFKPAGYLFTAQILTNKIEKENARTN